MISDGLCWRHLTKISSHKTFRFFSLWLSHKTLQGRSFSLTLLTQTFSSCCLFWYPLRSSLIRSKLLAVNVLWWPSLLGHIPLIWCFKTTWRADYLTFLFIYLAFFEKKIPQAQGVRAFFRLNHNVNSICCRGQNQSKLILKPPIPWSSIHNLAFINKNVLKKRYKGWQGPLFVSFGKTKFTKFSVLSPCT